MKYVNIEHTNRLKIEVDNVWEQIIVDTAEKSCKRLKKVSPKGKRKKKKYRNGWKYTKDAPRGKFESTVYNKTNYQLTHLLENGHYIVNKKDGVGWAEPHEHINKTYEEMKPEFIERMSKVGVTIKE